MALPPDQEGAGADEAPQHQPDELEILPISDDDFIIRKVPADHIHPTDGGKRRISKSAFSPSSVAVDPEEGMSTNAVTILSAEAPDLTKFALEFPALARLSVREVRALGLDVEHRPLPNDKSHCQVLGVKEKHRKKLLRAAEFIRKPDDVD